MSSINPDARDGYTPKLDTKGEKIVFRQENEPEVLGEYFEDDMKLVAHGPHDVRIFDQDGELVYHRKMLPGMRTEIQLPKLPETEGGE